MVLLVLLWGGLTLCVAAMVRYWRECQDLFVGVGPAGWGLLGLAFILVWVLAISSWQRVVAVYSGVPVTTPVAARHLALLLLGKYLPGGIWGFIARLSDSAQERSFAAMFAAGVSEQWLGLVSMSAFAGLGLLSIVHGHLTWLWAALAVPSLAMVALFMLNGMLQSFSSRLPMRWRLVGAPTYGLFGSRQMWEAVVMASAQQALILGIVAFIAKLGYSLGGESAVAVASSYGLAVAAGIATVFVPGGIIVREGIFVALSGFWLQPAQAVALAAGLRLVFTMFDLLSGTFAAGLYARSRSE